MINSVWEKLPEKFTNVSIDQFVIMPNHIHGIIILTEPKNIKQNNENTVGADPRVCPKKLHATIKSNQNITPERHRTTEDEHTGSPLQTVGNIVQWFKTITTNHYINGVKTKEWKPFKKKLWQRNYYEHIIRNEDDLHQLREYIIHNPSRWEEDKENPTLNK